MALTGYELGLVGAAILGYPIGRIMLAYLDRWHHDRLMSMVEDTEER